MTRLTQNSEQSFNSQINSIKRFFEIYQPAICKIGLFILCSIFITLLLPHLSGKTLSYLDEYLTAERAREFLILKQWNVVYLNFEPNFNKPPLQYFFTAFSLHWIQDRELAVRIWSLFYATGCIILTFYIYLHLRTCLQRLNRFAASTACLSSRLGRKTPTRGNRPRTNEEIRHVLPQPQGSWLFWPPATLSAQSKTAEEYNPSHLPCWTAKIPHDKVGSNLCRQVLKQNAWFEALLSAAFVAAYGYFIDSAKVAMLDMGLTFYLLLTFFSAFKASHNRWCWILCGLAAGLGTWQKNFLPLIAFGASLLFLKPSSQNQTRHKKWIWAGICIALAISLSWPLLQAIYYPSEYFDVLKKEILQLMFEGPKGANTHASVQILFYFIGLLKKWSFFGIIALSSILFFYFIPDLKKNRHYILLALFSLFYLAIMSFLSFKRHRYLLPIIPLLSILGVFFLSYLFSYRRKLFYCTAILFLSLTLISASSHIQRKNETHDDLLLLANEVSKTSQLMTSSEKLIVIHQKIRNKFTMAFLYFYADLKQPIEISKKSQLEHLPPGQPIRGIIDESHLHAIEPLLDPLNCLKREKDLISFTALRKR